MRADRLLQIVLILQTHGRLTAGDLAKRLEVSARTIQRDLDALSLAGIPVYANRGRGGGWSLSAGYRTKLNGLNPAEAASLFIGTTTHVLSDLGLDAASSTAVTKLLSAVPPIARQEADRARERVLVDTDDWWGSREASPWLPILQHGLWNDQQVTIEYGSAPDAFTVAPLGLVAKKRSWYLVAQRTDDELRTYRVSKVRRATATDRAFDRPGDFDLAEHWGRTTAQYFADLRDYPVQLRVRGTVGHRLRWAPNAVIEETTERPDGWWDVAMTFESAYETRVYLLGLAGDIVVVEPAELRDDMLQAARSLVTDHHAGVDRGGRPR